MVVSKIYFELLPEKIKLIILYSFDITIIESNKNNYKIFCVENKFFWGSEEITFVIKEQNSLLSGRQANLLL